jgi:lipoic acid synthetase
VDIATIGQYLPPTAHHLPLERFVEPQEFDMYRRKGLEMGFRRVESGPLVRSSYHAQESFSARG